MKLSPRVRGLVVWLVLGLLVCAQHHATLHWLSHAIEAVEATQASHAKDHGEPATEHCSECDGLMAFAAAAPAAPTAHPFVIEFEHIRPCFRWALQTPATAWVAYLSRAPPALA